MVKKKKNIQEVAMATEPVAVEDMTPNDNLRENLEEIKTYEGVIGYILRNSAAAAIDIKDPAKIIDYAILSSSALDAGVEFSELFDLGNIANIIVEGKNVKMLCMAIGENKVSVFMEKTVNCKEILKKLTQC